MLKTLYKISVPAFLSVGLAFCLWAASLAPALPPVKPERLVGTQVAFNSTAKGKFRTREVLPDATELAARFHRGASRPVGSAPAAVATVPEKPRTSEKPALAAKPQISKDLSCIGPVTVDGVAQWVLFDKQRNASFTIAPGGIWAVWTCVTLSDTGLIMKRGDELYVVPVKK